MAGAPNASDAESEEGDEEGVGALTQLERSNPLQPAEWQRLLAAVRELAIAELVERLAAHHGIPVLYPADPPALVELPVGVVPLCCADAG
jgi:hypothetical protein